jgi:PAS domain-containing protein
MVLWGIAYFAIRAGHYRWSVGLSVGIASVVVLAIVITDDSLEDTGYLLIPLLVSSLILHPRVTIAIAVADVFGMLLLPSLMTGVTFEMVLMGPVIYIAFGSVLILLTARHRNQIEKERQTRLRESEERLRSVISQSVDGLILVEDGVVSEWNQGLERITGVPSAEMIGRPMWYVLESLSPPQHKATAGYQQQFAELNKLAESPNTSWFNESLSSLILCALMGRREPFRCFFSLSTGKI